ncbi:hypothetical protein C4D60_Mb11t05170 [Musa balbisiana]|uniref:Uncharacterized protein n=1 Tax=Musa balbisiana TaxID=52838 RepID=A0A4S8J3C3_MUSBA|nr:hypothetical protein C4D60_Mb11t05170 [Musa balbisiana]
MCNLKYIFHLQSTCGNEEEQSRSSYEDAYQKPLILLSGRNRDQTSDSCHSFRRLQIIDVKKLFRLSKKNNCKIVTYLIYQQGHIRPGYMVCLTIQEPSFHLLEEPTFEKIDRSELLEPEYNEAGLLRLMVNPLASDHYMHDVILLEAEEEPLRSKEVFMLFDNEF